MNPSDHDCARRLEAIQRLAHIGVWEWDLQTDESYWSDETFRLFGLEPGEIRPCYEAIRPLIHPDDLEKWEAAIRLAVQAGDHYSLDFRLRRADEEVVWIHDEADVLRDEADKALKFIGIAQDITERVQDVEALAKSEERFRFVFEHSPIGKSMTTPAGTVCPNQAFLDLLGYSADEAFGLNWRELTHPDDLEENRVIVQSILDGERASACWEKRYLHKDGHVIPVEIHTYLQRDPQGVPQFFISTVFDLSARKLAEARLLEALEAKEILLKELHHRTKNNMQVISSMLAFQASASSDPALKQVLNENIFRIRAMALVHQKLYQASNLSRIQFGDYLQELVPLLISGYHLGAERVSVLYDLDPVELDLELAMSAGLAVNEMLNNALKYAFPDERPGQIQIGLHRNPDGEIELIIADNGVGFAADFNPAQAATLGLKLVEKTVKLQLKGRMEIHTHPGVKYSIFFKETPSDA